MTSVFPTTPINICSLLSFGILFVLIIPLALYWDNRNETLGILPPSSLKYHWSSMEGAAARHRFQSSPPFIHLIFPGQVLSWVVAQGTKFSWRLNDPLCLHNHLSPTCPWRPSWSAPILQCQNDSWSPGIAGMLPQQHGQLFETFLVTVCYLLHLAKIKLSLMKSTLLSPHLGKHHKSGLLCQGRCWM